MTINLILHHLQTLALVMAGLAPGSSPAATPGPMVACTTRVDVGSSISNGQITVTATNDDGTSCLVADACVGNSPVTVKYDTSSNKFMYLDVSNGLVVNNPPTSLTPTSAGGSIDFAVTGDNGGTLLWVPDPKITVKTGTCTGDTR